MFLSGVIFIVMLLIWLCGRKHLSEQRKRMLGIVTAAALLGVVAGYAGKEDVLLEGHRLARRAAGEGSYEQKLVLAVEGYGDAQMYEVNVPEQVLTREEEQACLQAAKTELEAEFPGENASLNEIREQVYIRDRYQNGKVTAEWSFDNYKIMDFAGNVIAADLPEEGTLVEASVLLTCGTSSRTEIFYFQVFPQERSGQEEVLYRLAEQLKAEGEMSGTAFLTLPENIGENRLTWDEPRDWTSEKVLFFGGVLAAFVPYLERSRKQEAQKKRDRLLEMEYPDIVSKMALLLGAGMTLRGAFRRIAITYEEKKKQKKCPQMPAYEEMLITCHELESGMGEGRAYERFGERCMRSDYRKLGNILAQNLRKGSQGVIALLEQEAENAFEERKSTAKRYGEEAGTKLLVPMILMLGIVMAILMVPAIMTFQI